MHTLDRDPYLRRTAYNLPYLLNDLDRLGQAAATKLARKLSREDAMDPFFASEVFPGQQVVRAGATLDEWVTHVQQQFRPAYHGVGTCMGGVVDARPGVRRWHQCNCRRI